MPFSDGSHRLQGGIIASEAYDVSNVDLVLRNAEERDGCDKNTNCYSEEYLPIESVVYEKLAMKIAFPSALTDDKLLASMRYDSEDCATTNEIAEGHTFKDALRNALRKLAKKYENKQLI